jgi:hypothetical protein
VMAARWIKSRAGTMKEEVGVVITEGEQFGKGKDGEACISESLRRLDAAKGIMQQAKQKIFLQSCLETATVAPEMCRGIPGPTEFMKTAQWQLDECARRGRPNNQGCAQLIGAVQMYCAGERRRR